MEPKALAILEKVSGLYMKFGIRSVTMDDVARELGISKKTLYEHFADKSDLVKCFIENQLGSMDREFLCISNKKINAIERLLEISDMLIRFMREFNPSVNFDLQKYYSDIWSVLMEYKRDQVFNHVKENLVQGVSEGLYRKDINPDIIARMYVLTIVSAMETDFAPLIMHSFLPVFREIITYHIQGIGTRKGIDLFERISKKHKLFEGQSI
jgi:TetR/AcrR family transcriptional regulator, cholesterol catabolism regulator